MAVSFYLSMVLGFEYQQGLWAAAIAATALAFGAIAAVGAEVPAKSDAFAIRRARHAICGVIAAASPTAVAWFLLVQLGGFLSAVIAFLFTILALWMAYEVVRYSTEERREFPTKKFLLSIVSMLVETFIVLAMFWPPS